MLDRIGANKCILLILSELLLEVQILMVGHSWNFGTGGKDFSYFCHRVNAVRVSFASCSPPLWSCRRSIKCILNAALCSRLLIKSQTAESGNVPVWNKRWNFSSELHFWAFTPLCRTGEVHGKRCLTCSPVVSSHSCVAVFMGKSLVRSQLQSLSEVSAGGLPSVQGREGITVNTQKHAVLTLAIFSECLHVLYASERPETKSHWHTHSRKLATSYPPIPMTDLLSGSMQW